MNDLQLSPIRSDVTNEASDMEKESCQDVSTGNLSMFRTDEIWEELNRRGEFNFDFSSLPQYNEMNQNIAETLIELQTTQPIDVIDLTTQSDDEDGDNVYEVEELLDKKVMDGKDYFLVKWAGFAPVHNSWEPRENIIGAETLLLARAWDQKK